MKLVSLHHNIIFVIVVVIALVIIIVSNHFSKLCVIQYRTYFVSFFMQFVLGAWPGIKYCYKNKCQNGALCRHDVGRYTYKCYCPNGFNGKYCEHSKQSLYLLSL